MKVNIKFFSIAIFYLFFVSCEARKESQQRPEEIVKETAVLADVRQVKVEIKGMTCEIGCARLIQSKLYKQDGISSAKISFEDSSGIVSFDHNRISKEDIKKIIEQTAGGDIYSVTSIIELEKNSTDGIQQ